jgi:hypothetical protein
MKTVQTIWALFQLLKEIKPVLVTAEEDLAKLLPILQGSDIPVVQQAEGLLSKALGLLQAHNQA